LVLNELVGRSVLIDPARLSAELGGDPRDLTADQLDEARASWMRVRNAAEEPLPPFLKTHSINRVLPSGRSLADSQCGQAVYITRHPLDVAVSYASFTGVEIKEMISRMLRPTATVDRPDAAWPARLPEYLATWSAHVDSWTLAPRLPTTVVRYEDLLADPAGQLLRIIDAVGVQCADGDVEHAVEVCAFPKLQELERDQGFELTPPTAERFFRAGTTGQGREVPTDASERLLDEARGTLVRLGYA
jgi:hypothetical protein